MKPRTAHARVLLAAVLALSVIAAVPGVAAEPAQYICRPCGCEHDDEIFDQAGTCPSCGMALVRKDSISNVGILIFDGVQIIDYTAPYEIFGQVSELQPFTVAADKEPITTAMGMDVIPTYSFADAPPIDILVVPGGNILGFTDDRDAMTWVKTAAETAEHVLTVCNGAFILAATGLLDGQRATTFYGLIDDLQRAAPEVEVVRGERFVDNGKIITTAGLSSGIEGSLHLVSKLRGEAAARALALHLEYEWRPESNFARAVLADLRMPSLEFPASIEAMLVSTRGNRESWEKRWELTTQLTADELLTGLRDQMAQNETWQPVPGSAVAWSSRDNAGARWTTEAELKPIEDGRFLLSTRIYRAPS